MTSLTFNPLFFTTIPSMFCTFFSFLSWVSIKPWQTRKVTDFWTPWIMIPSTQTSHPKMRKKTGEWLICKLRKHKQSCFQGFWQGSWSWSSTRSRQTWSHVKSSPQWGILLSEEFSSVGSHPQWGVILSVQTIAEILNSAPSSCCPIALCHFQYSISSVFWSEIQV